MRLDAANRDETQTRTLDPILNSLFVWQLRILILIHVALNMPGGSPNTWVAEH